MPIQRGLSILMQILLQAHTSLLLQKKHSVFLTHQVLIKLLHATRELFLPHPQTSELHTCAQHRTAPPVDTHRLSWNARFQRPRSWGHLGLLAATTAPDVPRRYDER